jgi:hypothetical protein
LPSTSASCWRRKTSSHETRVKPQLPRWWFVVTLEETNTSKPFYRSMLVTCPECAARISNQAKRCPGCGFPDAGRKSKEAAEETKARLETAYLEYRAGGPTFFSQPCPLGEARHGRTVRLAVGHTFEVRSGGKSAGYWVCGTYQCECGHAWEVKF